MRPSTLGAMRRQRGFSLIEIMVGLTVGMLLVAGLSLMFANASRSNTEMDKSVQHIENGRYAMDLLAQDISLAGFYGTVPTRTPSAPIAACADTPTLETLIGGVGGTGASGTVPPGIQGLTPNEASSLSCLSNYKAETPALVVRRLSTTAVLPGTTATVNGVLYVQASHNAADTTDSTYLGSASYTAKLGSGNTTTDATRFNLRAIQLANRAPVRQFISRIYYIASCNVCTGPSADTIPTLKVVEVAAGANSFTTSALVEGIDMIGFDYGVDTDGNSTPNVWYGLNDATGATAQSTHMSGTLGWGNVMAVRVHLVSRTTTVSSNWTDPNTYPVGSRNCTTGTTPTCATRIYTPTTNELGFKRRGYSSTIRLQSWAGQRET